MYFSKMIKEEKAVTTNGIKLSNNNIIQTVSYPDDRITKTKSAEQSDKV
jgi:hypothetical protein